MTAKTFSIALLCVCASLVAGTALLNVVIDPQFVFRVGPFQAQTNPNERYRHLLEYERDARKVDGLLFASSRGSVFDTAAIARMSGVNHVASFAVPAGAMSDHLPFLEFVLQDKALHGEKIAKVLLLLDADLFGTRPWTNLNLDSFLPPEVSGESAMRFWLRYLFAVQFKGWREALGSGRHAAGLTDRFDVASRRDSESRSDADDHLVSDRRQDRSNIPEAGVRIGTPAAGPSDRLARISKSRRPFLEDHLARLERFVLLCRRNGIDLTVAINPLTFANSSSYEPGSLQTAIAGINRITDVWDFAAPDWLGRNSSYWLDVSHYRPEIAQMMLRRIFTGRTSVPVDFGRLRPKTGP